MKTTKLLKKIKDLNKLERSIMFIDWKMLLRS